MLNRSVLMMNKYRCIRKSFSRKSLPIPICWQCRIRYSVYIPDFIWRPNLTRPVKFGTGYFTLEIAKLLEMKGKVIFADIQKGMPEVLEQKIKNSELQKQIQILNNQENTFNWTEKVDFILAFYAFHEMKYIDNIINELQKIVTPETNILIPEQKIHVSK